MDQAIYEGDYWALIMGDDLTAGLGLVILDHVIIAGPASAIRLMCRETMRRAADRLYTR